MPAPYARRDAFANLARAVNRSQLGQAQGRFRGLSPTSSGVVQSTRTDPSIQSYAELHHIQDWDITDAATDTFHLDFEPCIESWNLFLNGVRVHRTEFEVDVKTLTIFDPADLFLGADTQGTPWELEIQYDYIVGAPNDLALRNVSTAEGSSSTLPIAAPTGLEVGDLMILVATYGWLITPPAGWTTVEPEIQIGAGPPSQFTSVYKKVATGADLGATYTLAFSAAAENQAAIVAYSGAAAVTAHSLTSGTSGTAETGISTTVAASIVMHIITARAATGTVTPLAASRGAIVVDGSTTYGGNWALHITDEVQSAAGPISVSTASSTGSNPGQLGVIALAISPA